jgi:uncharacterized protein (DUF2252 family)
MNEAAPNPTESAYEFPKTTLSLAEAHDRGRALRKTYPRRSFAAFVAPDRDAIAIIEEQNRDRLPDLVPVRIGRMLQSPFAYYRGTAAVMANDLAAEPRTGLEVVTCGDAHLSNFGMFASPERAVLFDLNDFDETAFGPWEWDVKRLVASAVIGGRDRGFDTGQCTDAAMAAAAGYREALAALFELTVMERFYFRIDTEWLVSQANASGRKILRQSVKKAQRRTSDQVLGKITEVGDHGTHRIVDEFPVIRHDASVPLGAMDHIYDAYRITVRTDVAYLLQQFRVVDAVLRVVGVGSVGTRCFISLLLGPSDEPLFLQIKEAPPSVLKTYGKLASSTRGASENKIGREGWRVVAGQRILQAASDAFLGWMSFEGRDYYVRQFRDMKGAVDLSTLTSTEFARYAQLCGGVLARAHAQSSEAALIDGYLGGSARVDDGLVAWAHAYADQVERDYADLERAVQSGRLPAEHDV